MSDLASHCHERLTNKKKKTRCVEENEGKGSPSE